MGVQVTIRPHVVFDKVRGHNVEFDQFQILIGQRVCGYLGKLQNCQPKLVAANLPEDCLAAINDACDEQLQRGKYAAEGAAAPGVPAAVVRTIGSDPKKDKREPLPAPDAAASAALEEAIEASNPPKKNAA